MTSEKRPFKRLIVCCDGTWKDADGRPDVISNVTRIARCLKNEAKVGDQTVPQIVYYQSGVGTDRGWINRIIGGVSGKGISDNIREAYSFICNNYSPGDEVFLVGFSRGAFTARSISTLMQSVGILTRKGLVYMYAITKDWENQDKPHWKSPFKAWPGKPNDNVKSEEYRRELISHELSVFDVPVKACAVFDTVGSLGIPSLGLIPQLAKQPLAFVDTKIEKNIEHAFQALALDELRRPFSPTIWEVPDGQQNPKVLKQCWFPGVHSDIGGGYPDSELANITMAWMVSNLEPFLDFDKSYILEQQDLTNRIIKGNGEELSDWGLGRLHDSFSPEFWLAGKRVRTPANYFEIEPSRLPMLWGFSKYHSTQRRLRNTRQTIHASVRVRKSLNQEGLGYNSKGKYECAALEGWTFKQEISIVPKRAVEQRGVYAPRTLWTRETGDKDEPVLEMEEEKMGELEKLLLEHWSPQVWDDLPSLSPTMTKVVMAGKSSTFPKTHTVDFDENGRPSTSRVPSKALSPHRSVTSPDLRA